MRWKLKSDKSFLDFIRSSDKAPRLALLVVVGVFLILIGSVNIKTNTRGEERRVEEMCSMIEGVGDCRVMMTYRDTDGEAQVYAVTILCEGAESVCVREDLTEMVCSLYGIGHNRVEIFLLNEK